MGVRMFKLQNLADAYCLTNLKEAILNAVKKKNKMQFGASSSKFGNNEGNTGASTKPLLALPNATINWSSRHNINPPRKQLSQNEYEKKRVVGLFVNGQELHILIDSGFTYNFLDTKMAKRPYRHPPIQKDAIKAMVKEFLESGVIKLSQSPFSSPIVMFSGRSFWGKINHSQDKLYALLEGIWESISMDFIKALPKSQGYTVIFMVVDRLTKYGHFMPLSYPFTTVEVAQEFLDTVYKLHGLPISIVSERDKVFLINFWKELFKLLQVKLLMSTAYHPQTDGYTEVVNRCLECFLRLYGQTPPVHVPYLGGLSKVDAVNRTLGFREQAIHILKFHLNRSQNMMKQQADKSRMIERIGQVAYNLDLPAHSQIHNVFHVSQLKLCQGSPSLSQVMKLPSCNTEGLMEPEPIALLDRKMDTNVFKGNGMISLFRMWHMRTLGAREQAIQMLKFHLNRSQNRMKQQANKRRDDDNATNPLQVPPTLQSPYTLSTIKLPVLKKSFSTEDANKKFLSTQNVAFVSSDNTNSTNEVVSTAYSISTSSGHNSQKEVSSSYTDDLIRDGFEMAGGHDFHEMKKFYKNTGRKMHFDAKEPVSFDKNKVECFNCHNTGHFARECRSKGNQESVDWIGHAEDGIEDYALMAFNSSNSGSDTEIEAQLVCHQKNQLAYEETIRLMKIDLDDKTKGLSKLLNSQISVKDKSGLGYGTQTHEGVLTYENEVFESVFDSRSSDVENSHVN
nr:hypothetical protein [Tanacetum cinerariifolium]